jgi:hypothetical protein
VEQNWQEVPKHKLCTVGVRVRYGLEHTYSRAEDTQCCERQSAAHSGDEQRVEEERVLQAVAVAFVQILQLHGTG